MVTGGVPSLYERLLAIQFMSTRVCAGRTGSLQSQLQRVGDVLGFHRGAELPGPPGRSPLLFVCLLGRHVDHVARSLIHSSSVIGRSLMMYLPIVGSSATRHANEPGRGSSARRSAR
jgi:hypothetical protein